MENQILEVVLFPFQTKGNVEKVERWTLPAKGEWPEKDYKTLTFLDIRDNKIDRLNIPTAEFERVEWVSKTGEVLSLDELDLFYANLNDNLLPLCEFVFETRTKGRYSVLTLIRVVLGENLLSE